ncbi:MAG: hypothetical protein ACRDD7_17760 [Peptostreptococcaceae bacterium]
MEWRVRMLVKIIEADNVKVLEYKINQITNGYLARENHLVYDVQIEFSPNGSCVALLTEKTDSLFKRYGGL